LVTTEYADLKDKTGTLTENRLRVADVFPFYNPWGFVTKAQVLEAAALASEEVDSDPIDKAILDSVSERVPDLKRDVRLISFEAFHPANHRFTKADVETLHSKNRYFVIKGPLVEVLKMCSDNLIFNILEKKAIEYASFGWRCVCVASSGFATGLTIPLGIIAFEDPIRSDVNESIQCIQNMCVQTIMLTGDSLAVARFVCSRSGLASSNRIFSRETQELQECPENEVLEYSGFASIFPQDKVSIIDIYHSFGFVIGMTGDGVNDAPSLKLADIGIAVESATDVAKSCSSVILTKPGIGGVVDLITSSRNIHRRILTWTMNKILKAFQTNVFMCVLFLYKKKLILDEKHLIYLLFCLDLVTLALATDNVLISQNFALKSQVGKIIIMCSVLGLISMFEFLILYERVIDRLSFSEQPTAAFEMLFFFGILNVFCLRVNGFWWSSKPGRDLVFALSFDLLIAFLLVHTNFADIEEISVSVSFLIFLYDFGYLTTAIHSVARF
jgi:H+-transporting ATPase